MAPMDADRVRKTREQAARRAAQRQGLRLERSRMRDPRGLDYGLYRLVDIETGECVGAPPGRCNYTLTLDAVERVLDDGRK
jgi:hypothetical protein